MPSRTSPLGLLAGLPAGFSVRRPSPDDRTALHALCSADETASVGHSLTSISEVDELLAPAHTSLAHDQWLVLDATGTPVVWGLLWDDGNTNHQDVDLYRDRSRAGEDVRGLVLDQLLVRVAQRARARGYERVDLGAGCLAQDVVYPQTLRSRGFEHVRTFRRMRIDLDPGREVAVTPVEGVTIEAFDAADEQAWRDLHRVVDVSFAQHWGSVPVRYADYRADADAEPNPDLPLWRVARLDGRMVGVARASGRHADEGGGWVSELGVLPDVRGRGVARALLQSMFEASRRAGRRYVGLGVDTQNTTGAVRLYESVGMWEDQQIHAYSRAVLAE